MLMSCSIEKAGVGTITVIGDVPEGDEFRVRHIDFGEYIDLSGRHFPLSQKQTLGIVQLASTETEAIMIAECEDHDA